jgi:hypothetical protein
VKVVLSGRAADGSARKTRSASTDALRRDCATRGAFQAAMEEEGAEAASVAFAASSAPARA